MTNKTNRIKKIRGLSEGPFIIYRRGGGLGDFRGDLKFWPVKKGGSWSNC